MDITMQRHGVTKLKYFFDNLYCLNEIIKSNDSAGYVVLRIRAY